MQQRVRLLPFVACLFLAACASTSPVNTATPKKFGGNHNYYVGSTDCTPMRDVKVIIDIQADLVSTKGLGFQLNAHSLKTDVDPPIFWQQYMTGITVNRGDRPVIHDSTENWGKVDGKGQVVVREETDVFDLPRASIPAGSRFVFELKNDPAGNIIGARYTFIEADGRKHPLKVDLDQLKDFRPGNVAPIVAYQMNLVGPTGSALSAGKGTITYESSTLGQATGPSPACSATRVITAEHINSVYSPLPDGPFHRVVQEFSVGDN